MTPRRRPFIALVLAASAAVGALLPACFAPKEVPCAFSCLEPPHRCPEEFTCGDDGLCHREGATGECSLAAPGDAGRADAAGEDAATAALPR